VNNRFLSIMVIPALLLAGLLLTSCSDDSVAPTATPVPELEATAVPPTAAPTEESPAEPTAVEVIDDEGAMDNAFITSSWQWVSFTNPNEQYDIEMPQNYVLTFYVDGAVTIIADCNTVVGNYMTDAGTLSIALGPATLAACSPESRSDQFTQYLSSAASYFFEEGNLYIDLMADGGTMAFSPVDLEGLVDEDAIVSSVPADIVTQLDAFLQSQVYTENGDPNLAAPGLVLYVETPDGRYLNSAGVANLEDGTLVQVDDILEIGSNTKSMTIVLLMQLVEEGLISLDDPLSQYLPDQAALVPNGDQITIRQMAQHTAGLYDYADNIMAAGIGDPQALEAGFVPAELVQDAVDNGSPYFAPGQEGQWHYSNTGYVLLGMIIESLTGEEVADLYQTRIFDPLGMESAIFLEDVPQPGDIDTHGYWWTEDGERIDTTNWNGSQGWVAGAAAMTAEDLATYAKALAAGELFQNPDTLNEMLTFYEAAKLSVGGPYGLGLIDFAGDGTVWGHGGETLGFQSLWLIQPETGNVVVGLTNSAAYGANAFLNVLNILEGKGAQPLSSWTLTLLGEFVGTTWAWKQSVSSVEAVDIDETAGLSMILSRNGTVAVSSAACGEAFGAYTSTGIGNISFDIDDSSWTCADDSPAGQFVDYLSQATSWSFNNGSLLVELPADGGTMVFANVPLQ
jgi:D-alanyl-D-alanine carboxypeptidase